MAKTPLFTPVLIGGCIVILMSFAVRASFGVFQIPIAEDFGWPRAEFSLAIAIQNLAWGIGQPLFGALAERFGDRRAIVAGGAFYALGLVLSAVSVSPLAHQALNVLIGFGIAGMGFGVVLAVVGRAASDENRSMALGIATAAGSAGQVVGAPLAEWLLGMMSWQAVFVVFAGIILASLMALPLMRAPARASRAELEESMGEALTRAFRDPSFTLIFLGFFSCGYQLAFITAHFPAFVTELCGPIDPGGALHAMGITTTSALGAVAISLIGLANIAGTLTAGWLGKRYTRKYLLAAIYTAPHPRRRLVHHDADHAGNGDRVLGDHGRALARHGAAHLGARGPYLRPALHGHALRDRVPQPPDRRLPRRLARGQALRHLRRLHDGLVDRRRRGRLLGACPPAGARAAAGGPRPARLTRARP